MKERNLFPFFDMAYQGFASATASATRRRFRIFVEDGHKVGCSQSFAKNMGSTVSASAASASCAMMPTRLRAWNRR